MQAQPLSWQLPPQPIAFKGLQCCFHSAELLLSKQQPGGLSRLLAQATHRIQQATATKPHHRRAGGHGLHWSDAEILQAGIDIGAAASQQLLHLMSRGATKEASGRTRHRLKPGALRAITHHHQGQIQLPAGLHHQIHALVGHQTADREIEIFPGLLPIEARHINWWRQHRGAAAPVTGDALGREARISDQMIRASWR